MQIIYFEFSWMFMKTIEMNKKKVQKNQGAIQTKLLVFHLIIAQWYQTWYHSNTKYSDSTLQTDRKSILFV